MLFRSGDLGEMEGSQFAEMAETGIQDAQVRDALEAERERQADTTGNREEPEGLEGRGDISVSW